MCAGMQGTVSPRVDKMAVVGVIRCIVDSYWNRLAQSMTGQIPRLCKVSGYMAVNNYCKRFTHINPSELFS